MLARAKHEQCLFFDIYKPLGVFDVFLRTSNSLPDSLLFFHYDLLGLQMFAYIILSKNSAIQ
jgi:hypothetical protein